MAAIMAMFKRMPEAGSTAQIGLRSSERSTLSSVCTQGIPQTMLPAELPGTSANVRRDAVNRLLKDNKVQLVQSAADNSLILKEVEAGKSAR